MKLCGLTVSVGYADLLEPSVRRWATALDRWIVVTTPDDHATLELCARHGVATYLTRAFFDDQAVFNKANAMSEAYVATPWTEFWLFIDADVIPPADWRARVEAAQPMSGNLYGCTRRLEDGSVYNEGEIAGYFQLFHASDPQVQRRPLLDCSWQHAGGYDSEFQFRWMPDQRIWIRASSSCIRASRVATGGAAAILIKWTRCCATAKPRAGLRPMKGDCHGQRKSRPAPDRDYL